MQQAGFCDIRVIYNAINLKKKCKEMLQCYRGINTKNCFIKEIGFIPGCDYSSVGGFLFPLF